MTDIAKLRELLAKVEAARGEDGNAARELREFLRSADEDYCNSWLAMDGRTDLARERFVRTWSMRAKITEAE
jgi:hypothetical protein